VLAECPLLKLIVACDEASSTWRLPCVPVHKVTRPRPTVFGPYLMPTDPEFGLPDTPTGRRLKSPNGPVLCTPPAGVGEDWHLRLECHATHSRRGAPSLPSPSIQRSPGGHGSRSNDDLRQALTREYLAAHLPAGHAHDPQSVDMTPRAIVLHWTGTGSAKGAWHTFAPATLGGRPELRGVVQAQ